MLKNTNHATDNCHSTFHSYCSLGIGSKLVYWHLCVEFEIHQWKSVNTSPDKTWIIIRTFKLNMKWNNGKLHHNFPCTLITCLLLFCNFRSGIKVFWWMGCRKGRHHPESVGFKEEENRMGERKEWRFWYLSFNFYKYMYILFLIVFALKFLWNHVMLIFSYLKYYEGFEQ